MCILKANELQKIFKRLDRDGDGHVSIGELSWFLDKIGAHTELDELEAIVGHARLNMQEFIFFYESICNNGKGNSRGEEEGEGDNDEEESDLYKTFKVFDLNNDGFISCEELQSVLMKLGLWESGGDCSKMIYEFDTNSDGLLDFEEFKSMMLLSIH